MSVTAYYVVVPIDAFGNEGAPSAESSVVEDFLYITVLTWTPVEYAVSYRIWRGLSSGTYTQYLDVTKPTRTSSTTDYTASFFLSDPTGLGDDFTLGTPNYNKAMSTALGNGNAQFGSDLYLSKGKGLVLTLNDTDQNRWKLSPGLTTNTDASAVQQLNLEILDTFSMSSGHRGIDLFRFQYSSALGGALGMNIWNDGNGGGSGSGAVDEDIAGNLHIRSMATSLPHIVVDKMHNTDTELAEIHIRKSSNISMRTPGNVASTDYIGAISFWGYHTSQFWKGADIFVQTQNTPGASNDMPMQMHLRTSDNASASPVTRIRIMCDGKVMIGQNTPTNLFGVMGAGAIGSSYASTYTAPTNGLLIEGQTGMGVTSLDATAQLHVVGSARGAVITGGTNAALKITPQASDPASPASGDLYVNSGTGMLSGHNGTEWARYNGIVHVLTSNTPGALTPSTTEQLITGASYTIPANSCKVGTRFRVRASFAIQPGTAGLISLFLRHGWVSAGTPGDTLFFQAISPDTGSVISFMIEVEFVFTAIGAGTGAAITSGFLLAHSDYEQDVDARSDTDLDTTAAQVLAFTADYASVGDSLATLECRYFTVERTN